MVSWSSLSLFRRQQSMTNFNDIHANISSDDAYKFAHGLTGTDQPGNALATEILGGIFFVIALLTFTFRLARDFHGAVRERIIAEHDQNQKFWERGHVPWVSQVLKHSKDRPLRPGRSRDIQLTKSFSLGNVPTRNQLIFTVFYVSANILFSLLLPWKPIRAENVAALRGRTGHLATFNLMFTTLFAFRNNPLIWLFQVSFDTFNFYHRLFARITIVESLVHVICWGANTLSAGGRHGLHLSLESSLSYQWGMVSFVSFMIILIQAWSPLRRAWYNLFIIAHRILATLAIIGLLLHIHYHNLPQIVWASIAVGLLAGELLYRIVRILYLNFHPSSLAGTKITVRALSGASRVTIHLNRAWQPPPGTHVHIYIPSVSIVTSHPFSIAWSTGTATSNAGVTKETQPFFSHSISKSSSITKLPEDSVALTGTDADHVGDVPIKSTEGESDTERLLVSSSVSGHGDVSQAPTISLIVRARDGFTKQLHRMASRSPNGTYTTWGLVEGAYGTGPSLSSYGTVLLFAGGVGITHVVPYIRELLIRQSKGTATVRKLKLIWSVPNLETLDWIRDWLEEAWALEGAEETLEVILYVSRGGDQVPEAKIPGWIKIKSGRCNIDGVIGDEVQERIGAVAVMVCGPGAIAENVRVAVRKRMTECSIDLFEEAFTY